VWACRRIGVFAEQRGGILYRDKRGPAKDAGKMARSPDPPPRRHAPPNADTPMRRHDSATRRHADTFFLVSRPAGRHDRLAMHITRIPWCFGLSLLLYGISLQAARSEVPEPQKKENTSDSGSPRLPIDVRTDPVGPATSSTTAFDRVTQHLDPGGSFYFYWSLEKIVGHLAAALTTARDRVLPPSLSPNERERFIDRSDLVIQLIRSSGIEGLLAFGGSSKQVEKNLYLTKAFAYAPQPSGFLWQTFTKAPHRFAALDFLPANTEAFGLYDINLLALWQALLKDLAASRIQNVVIALNEFARQVHSNTGMTVDELLSSLGDEAGFVITLNQDAKVTIPLPNGAAEIPEPAGAIFWTVQDDRLFDRLDELFTTNPATQKEDRPDLRIRVIPGAAPVDYVRPTLARIKNYLIIASNDKLVRGFADSLAGNAPTISTVPEFKELAKDVGDSGNMAQYISKRFQQTYYEALWRYMVASGSAKDAGVLNWEKTLYDLLKDWAAYGVAVREQDGLYFVRKETKDINEFFGQVLTGPSYFLFDWETGSQTASSNDVEPTKKEPVDPATLSAIRLNLLKIADAKEKALKARHQHKTQPLVRAEVEKYLPGWVESVVGEIYEIGAIGEPPYATAPVDVANIPAGTRITP